MLASAAAAVSFTAQYRMILGTKHQPYVAGLEAAIPDASALIFASLGVALALHGRRAIRARTLNVAAVATSVFMNVIAAGPGWRAVSIWAMPPVAYALASDTMIGVVRARAVARHTPGSAALADDEPTPLAVVGGLALWLLRLLIAPGSTLAGFRSWVLDECPPAPGRRASSPAPRSSPLRDPSAKPVQRSGTKTARFLSLVEKERGGIAEIELSKVSQICSDLAPKVSLNVGAARTALRMAVLTAREARDRS